MIHIIHFHYCGVKNLSPDEINKFAEKYVVLREIFYKYRDEIKTQTKLTNKFTPDTKEYIGRVGSINRFGPSSK